MPLYLYKAKSFKGETKSGQMAARDEHELAKALHQQEYVLISATPKKQAGREKWPIALFKGLGGVTLTDKLMFTRNLQVMVATGISLPRALTTLAGQAKSHQFKKALLNMAEDIRKGENFSATLKKYPAIFSDFFYHLVKVGEESGTLEEALKNLTFQMEKEHELRSKVKSALIYPAVIITVMIAIAILMLIMVVPKLAQVFEELKVELPLTTQLVINAGQFLSEHFLIVLSGLFLLYLLARLYLKTREGKRIRDMILLKLPVITPLIKKVNASHTIRTLSVLMASGVSFVRSLEIVAGVLPNVYFKEAILAARERVQRGGKLSEALSAYGHLFPPTVIQMMEVGEETGESSKIFGELAEFLEEEVTAATKNLVSIIEPVLMVIIGAMVGFFAISMIQPIYSMLGAF